MNKISKTMLSKTKSIIVGLSIITAGQIINACKASDPEPSEIQKPKEILSPKYNGHISDGSEPFPIYTMEPASFSSEINGVGAKDSSTFSGFLLNGVLPNGNDMSNNIKKNGIGDFGINPQLLGTSVFTDLELQKDIGGDKISYLTSRNNLNFCKNIILPEFLKKSEYFYKKNGYYPAGGTIIVNIPSSYYTAGPVGTISKYQTTINGQNINLYIVFSISYPGNKLLSKDENLQILIGTIFHEIMHKITEGKFVKDDNKKIDQFGHDNNTYTAKYRDENGSIKTQNIKSVFNSTIQLGISTLNILIKDNNPQINLTVFGKNIDQKNIISISREGGQDIYIDDIVIGLTSQIKNIKKTYWDTGKIEGNGKFPRDNKTVLGGRISNESHNTGTLETICEIPAK